MEGNDVFGPGGLATRFAWGGAFVSAVIWVFAGYRIWKVEGSVHHLVARLLSVATMVALDVVIVIFFWPETVLPRPEFLNLNGEQARGLVAFVVGMQISAAIWQITAPPRRTKREPHTKRGLRKRKVAA